MKMKTMTKEKLNDNAQKALQKVINSLNKKETRVEQLQMTQFLTRFLDYAKVPGYTAIVEAGTGVGKSFGYLVAQCEYLKSIPFDKKHKTVIATNTISLQEQLIKKDIPVIQKLYPNIRFEKAKGRNNYVCSRLLAEAGNGDLFVNKDDDLIKIEEWLHNNNTGDKSDLDCEVSQETWKSVAADSTACHGRGCAYYSECYYEKAKKKLKKADVIITNHAVVLADIQNQNLPDYTHIIIDEAHNFEKNALKAMTVDISIHRFKYISRKVQNSYCQAGLRRVKKLTVMNDCSDHLQSFAEDFLSALPEGRLKDMIDTTKGDLLVAQLDKAIAILGAALTDETSIIQNELKLVIEETNKLRDELHAFLYRKFETYVYWVEKNKAYYAPTNTSFLGKFWATKTSILTSATINVAGSFNSFIWGLSLCRSTTYSLKLNSPFNYKKNALVYIPPNAISPKDKNYNDYLIETIPQIVKKTGGKTFVLFTSFASLNTVYEAVKEELSDFNLLKQGQGNKGYLLQEFKSANNSVLFGTDTFWEGVDEDLNCVIITKLPFAVPTDPIEEARYEKLKAAGKNPFLIKSLPACALKLKQGTGRLIRNFGKRGVIVICDPRINANWGKPIIQTLPEMKWTDNINQIDLYMPKIS